MVDRKPNPSLIVCTGLSEHSYAKFEQEVESMANGGMFEDPKVRGLGKETIGGRIPEEQVQALKNHIQANNRSGIPTSVAKCQEFMKDTFQVDLAKETMRRFMHQIVKVTRVRISSFGTAVESDRILELIDTYLRLKLKYQPQLDSGELEEVWTDESYVHENYAVSHMWLDGDQPRAIFNSPEGKGSRLILIHWTTKNGWIDEGRRVWICTKKESSNPDYHTNVTHDTWLPIFIQVCKQGKAAGKRYLFCLGNAGYHKTKEIDEIMRKYFEGRPLTDAKKAHLVAFLEGENIPFDAKLRRDELKKLVAEHYKGPGPNCVAIAKEYGHEVLFTPPYWPEFQPIEKAWAIAKGYVAKNRGKGDYNVHATKQLILKGFETVTPEVWRKLTESTHRYEEEMRQRRARQKDGLHPEFDSLDSIIAQTEHIVTFLGESSSNAD